MKKYLVKISLWVEFIIQTFCYTFASSFRILSLIYHLMYSFNLAIGDTEQQIFNMTITDLCRDTYLQPFEETSFQVNSSASTLCNCSYVEQQTINLQNSQNCSHNEGMSTKTLTLFSYLVSNHFMFIR